MAAQHRRLEVCTELDAAVVKGNPLQLSRLLTNLVDNAERHAVSRITLRVGTSGGQAYLSVSDDGEGIAPEFREKIFERFFRPDASRRRDAGGSGLGLSIAAGIAASHNGTLRVGDAAPGACFTLRLPLHG